MIRIGSFMIGTGSALIRIGSSLIRIGSSLIRIGSSLIRIGSSLIGTGSVLGLYMVQFGSGEGGGGMVCIQEGTNIKTNPELTVQCI